MAAFFKSHATVTSCDVELTKETASQRITTSSRRPYSDKHRTGKHCNVQITRDQCHVQGLLQIPCDSYVSRRRTNQGNNESTHYRELATTLLRQTSHGQKLQRADNSRSMPCARHSSNPMRQLRLATSN